jgi:hypothetical protein
MTYAIIVLSAIFAAIRLGFHRQVAHGLSWPGTFQDFAHIWVGFLLCLAIFGPKQDRKLSWWALAIISLGVEGVMFFVDNPAYRFWGK